MSSRNVFQLALQLLKRHSNSSKPKSSHRSAGSHSKLGLQPQRSLVHLPDAPADLLHLLYLKLPTAAQLKPPTGAACGHPPLSPRLFDTQDWKKVSGFTGPEVFPAPLTPRTALQRAPLPTFCSHWEKTP